jgi:hypothetical protein
MQASVHQLVVGAAAQGQVIDMRGAGDGAGGADSPVLDSEILYTLCVGAREEWPVHARGIHVIGARIVGRLDFSGATLRVPLTLEACQLDDGLCLERASVRYLSLSCSQVGAVAAADLGCALSLDFSRVRCPGAFDLRGASIGGFLSFAGAQLGEPSGKAARPALLATGLSVGRDLDLRGLQALGPLSLDRAKLGGRLDCTQAAFDSGGRDRFALSLTHASIGADLDLSEARSVGAVTLTGANILGGFRAENARLVLGPDEAMRQLGPEGMRRLKVLSARTEIEKTRALIEDQASTSGPTQEADGGPTPAKDLPVLDLRGARVGGAVALISGFRAEGEVRLVGTSVGLDVWCFDAVFIDKGIAALNAQGIRVLGNFLLHDGCVVVGRISLQGASIGGQFDCHEARMWSPDGVALNARSLNVGGTLSIHQGATVEGETDLTGSDIGGDLDCRGASFDHPAGVVFRLQGARVRGTFFWGPFRIKPSSTTNYYTFGDYRELYADPPTGKVDFTGARVGFLNDHWSAWRNDPDVVLDGFVYELLGSDAADYSWRVNWLGRQAQRRPRLDSATREALKQAVSNLPPIDYGRYNPQVFEQLATVYERMGNDAVARRIRIENQRAARASGRLGRAARLSNRLLDWTIRYGWEPWRVVVLGLFVVALGTIIFASLGASSFSSSSTSYRVFQPLAYSLDVFLPIIDLGQASQWSPRENVEWHPFGLKTSGFIVQVYLWIHIVLGWVVSSLAVVAFTGLVRRRN